MPDLTGSATGAATATADLTTAYSMSGSVAGMAVLAGRLIGSFPMIPGGGGSVSYRTTPRLPTPTRFPEWGYDLNRALSAEFIRISNRLAEILPVGSVRTVKKTSDQTVAETGPVDVTGLSFPVAAGHCYHFRFICLVQSDTPTIGVRMTVTIPTLSRFGAKVSAFIAADGTGATFDGAVTSSGDSVIPTAVPASATDYLQTVEGLLIPSASGTLQLQAGTETGTSNVIVRQGSVGILQDFGS